MFHTANMKAAGLKTRDQAKTFIYALLYGAGNAKIGSIIGKGAQEGAALRRQFLANFPASAAPSSSQGSSPEEGTPDWPRWPSAAHSQRSRSVEHAPAISRSVGLQKVDRTDRR